jgi:hypothetical protein
VPELEKCDSYGVDFDGASTARQSRGWPHSLAALELALSPDDLIISDALLIIPDFCVATKAFCTARPYLIAPSTATVSNLFHLIGFGLA